MEELLELVEDQQDGNEQADALELRPGTQVPAPPQPGAESEGGPQKAETAEAPVPAETENLPPDVEVQKWPAEAAPPPEYWGEIPSGGGPADSAMPETAPAEPVPAKIGRDGPEKIVTGSNGTPLLRRPGGGDLELAELPNARAEDGPPAADIVTASLQPAERGLEGLYRQAVRAARPAVQSPAAPRQGQAVRLGEPETPRQLTVDELDRAVRRDSRRYDGGLDIF